MDKLAIFKIIQPAVQDALFALRPLQPSVAVSLTDDYDQAYKSPMQLNTTTPALDTVLQTAVISACHTRHHVTNAGVSHALSHNKASISVASQNIQPQDAVTFSAVQCWMHCTPLQHAAACPAPCILLFSMSRLLATNATGLSEYGSVYVAERSDVNPIKCLRCQYFGGIAPDS